jgi:hypothetical protein
VRVRRPENLDAWSFRSLHNYSMDRNRRGEDPQARSRVCRQPVFEKLARPVVEDSKFGGGRRRAGLRRWSGPSARDWIEGGPHDKRPNPAVGRQRAGRDVAVPADASGDHIGRGVGPNCCQLERRQGLREGESARRGKLEGCGGRCFAHRDDPGALATDPFAGDAEDAAGDPAKAGTEGNGGGPGFEASPNPTTRPRTRLTITTVGMSGGIGTDRPSVRGRRSVVRAPSGSSWRSPILWSPLERD